MRKDKGLNGDLDRLPMLTWIMFLKFLDDSERLQESKAVLGSKKYRPAIEKPYRWRDWAENESGITGPELLAFIGQDEIHPRIVIREESGQGDETKRIPGLLAYLRNLQSNNGDNRRDVIATVFSGVLNRMESGYLLREVVNKVNGIHFNSTEEIQTLGHLYESMLREMRDAAGDSGEFYTPRAVVRFMVAVTDPKLGEVVLDPACGTGGFLVEAYGHLEKQCKTVQDRQRLQTASILGGEAKPLPYMLAQMNLLLHGLESPKLKRDNSLAEKITEIGDRERVDVILTNPPFGGEEERSILGGFPSDKQTAETALLFLQLIMRKLRRLPKPGRAAVVVPNGTLFGDGICARIKDELTQDFNLHTIVRLPSGVFAPYTPIPTNLLFFDRSGPTRDIWFYEVPLPEGRKGYTKTRPIQFEDLTACVAWWTDRTSNELAWKIDFQELRRSSLERAKPLWEAATKAEEQAKVHAKAARELTTQLQRLQDSAGPLFSNAKSNAADSKQIEELKRRQNEHSEAEKAQRELAKEKQAEGDALYWPIFNLDCKNPTAKQDFEHMPPEQLVDEILQKELRVAEILREIKEILGRKP
jgi:type I restriction enzyme M protein